jgi:hypothetical protein
MNRKGLSHCPRSGPVTWGERPDLGGRRYYCGYKKKEPRGFIYGLYTTAWAPNPFTRWLLRRHGSGLPSGGFSDFKAMRFRARERPQLLC